MKALDTNVVVRVLTADDLDQLALALEVMRSGPIWLAKTVLLETAWVLEHAYELEREVVLDALRKLCGYEGLTLEDADAVDRALDWHAAGMDLADALHLASAAAAAEFVTFDKPVARAAERAGARPPVRLLSGGKRRPAR